MNKHSIAYLMTQTQVLPRISYHGGHSAEFCDHAAPHSTPENIAQSYCDRGFTHFAITEHRPPHEEKFIYPEEKAQGRTLEYLQERFARYFEEVRPLLYKKFNSQAQIAVGFETEYYGKDPIDQTKELVDRYKPDIIVLSVHHVDDIPIDYSGQAYQEAAKNCGGLEPLYKRYYDQQYDLIRGISAFANKMPVIIGHFDLIKICSKSCLAAGTSFVWEDFSPALIAAIERNIDAAIQAGFVFEVNARAFKKELLEPYPTHQILKLIKEKQGEITVSDDSHGPEEVGLNYEKSLPFVKQYFNQLTAFERDENQAFCKVHLAI